MTNILVLPTELLVNIFLLLPTSREKVKMRYVSRRLQSVIEIPSLWSKFVWPLYDIREEICVNNLLKSCGGYVKTLSFPDRIPPSLQLVSMLEWCSNVKQLSIPNEVLNIEQLGQAVKPWDSYRNLSCCGARYIYKH